MERLATYESLPTLDTFREAVDSLRSDIQRLAQTLFAQRNNRVNGGHRRKKPGKQSNGSTRSSQSARSAKQKELQDKRMGRRSPYQGADTDLFL